jgi:hypothetical protein
MLANPLKSLALVAGTLATFRVAHAILLPAGTGPVAIDVADLPAGTFLGTATGLVNGGGFTGTARTAVC